MNNIINEDCISFKDLEKNIFNIICGIGRDITKRFLEGYDDLLLKERDKVAYRNKGKRKTTIKTVYGEVTYSRRIYEVTRESGLKEFVYLLDEQLKIPGIGLISQNMAEHMVSMITESSYREVAKEISETTGQTVSAMGVWNVIQSLGEKVCEDEEELVKAHKAGCICGETVTPVLFEETDGVHVRLQREKQDSGEIKVGLAYDGWKPEGKNRFSLDSKVVVAGFAKSKEFQQFREAAIAERYNTDEIEVRLMNADGSEWIKNICDSDTIFQLDPFHRNKAVKENIPYPKAAKEVMRLLDAKDLDGMFEYLEMYRNSLSDDKEIEKAERLITYFKNNRDGLLSYVEKGITLPEHPKGLIYRNMGTMENHIWSTIARRMKHNHTCWSLKGGNHLAKILAKKCSGRLGDVTEKLKERGFEAGKTEQVKAEILSAASAPKKDGKGYRYPVEGHLIRLDNCSGITRQMFLGILNGGTA